MPQELVVRIIGDASSLENALRKSSKATTRFGRDMDKTFRGTIAGSGAFRGLGRSIAFASAGFLGGFGLTVAIRSAFDEMSNMQKVSAQTASVLESTGGVAGVTAKHVEELGLSLLNLSGIDDELIKNSENLILTFKNIRNVGRGANAIFDRTAKGALDLSVRFGKDLPSATILLAKALNDPVRGLTALQRAGVQFDTSQRKTIKGLVESGQLFKAQRFILREVESQVGGAAKAYGDTLPGKLNKARETIRNLAGAVASALLPALTGATDRALAWLQNTKNQEEVVRKVTGAIKTLSSAIAGIADFSGRIAEFVGGWKNAITIVIGLWVGFKAAGILAAQQVMFANIVAAEGTAAAWKAALISTGFGALVVAAGAAAALIITHWTKVKLFFRLLWAGLKVEGLEALRAIVEPFSHLPMHAGQWARDIKAGLTDSLADARIQAALLNAELNNTGESTKGFVQVGKIVGGAIRAARRRVDPDERFAKPSTAGAVSDEAKQAKDRLKSLRQAREAFRQEVVERAQFAVERAGLTKTLTDDLVALNKLNALLKRRIKGGHDTVDLERQQLQVQQQITALLEQQAEARKAARDARQFRRLGFGPTGEDIIPGVKGLKRQLAAVNDAIKGSFLDTRKTRGLIAHIRQVLSGGLGSVSSEVRAKIQQILADLKDQLKQSSVDVTRFNKTASGQFVLQGASGAGSGNITVQGGIHLHGIQNMKQLEDELARRRKQRGHQRRSTR